jgi:hypothetical protein
LMNLLAYLLRCCSVQSKENNKLCAQRSNSWPSDTPICHRYAPNAYQCAQRLLIMTFAHGV